MHAKVYIRKTLQAIQQPKCGTDGRLGLLHLAAGGSATESAMEGRQARRSIRFIRFSFVALELGKSFKLLLFLLVVGAVGSSLVFWYAGSAGHNRGLVPGAGGGRGTSFASCMGRWIYIYNISTKFNQDLVVDCANLRKKTDPRNMMFCPYMENRGMGRDFSFGPDQGGPAENFSTVWFNTWQFSLEHYFHERFMTYPCVTMSENKAEAFFVPFYTGMDLIRRISYNLSRNDLHLELLDWLRTRSGWQRHGGLDHFLVLGRISSDFRRAEGSRWGNQMMLHADWQKMIKLTIERSSSKTARFDNEMAVPYPTYFHASTDSQLRDLMLWVSKSSQRSSLATFVGQGRPERLGDSVRKRVMAQCESDSRCTYVLCGEEVTTDIHTIQHGGFVGKTLQASCQDPPLLLHIFHRSRFCLQPPGDSPTRRSFFDAMLAGCIPVIFNKNSAWTQYTSHLPGNGNSYSVFLPRHTVWEQNVMSILESIPIARVDSMRAKIAELLPRVLYAHIDRMYHFGSLDPDSQFLQTDDAFDIALGAVLTKIRANRLLHARK